MRLAAGLTLLAVGLGLTLGFVVYALRQPGRALRDLAFWGIVDAIMDTGPLGLLLPLGLIFLGVMIIISEFSP